MPPPESRRPFPWTDDDYPDFRGTSPKIAFDSARLEAICRLVAPGDLAGKPMRVALSSMLPVEWAGGGMWGCAARGLDAALFPDQERGVTVVVNDVAIHAALLVTGATTPKPWRCTSWRIALITGSPRSSPPSRSRLLSPPPCCRPSPPLRRPR